MSSTFTRLNGLMFKNIPSRLLPVDFAVRMHVVKSDQGDGVGERVFDLAVANTGASAAEFAFGFSPAPNMPVGDGIVAYRWVVAALNRETGLRETLAARLKPHQVAVHSGILGASTHHDRDLGAYPTRAEAVAAARELRADGADAIKAQWSPDTDLTCWSLCWQGSPNPHKEPDDEGDKVNAALAEHYGLTVVDGTSSGLFASRSGQTLRDAAKGGPTYQNAKGEPVNCAVTTSERRNAAGELVSETITNVGCVDGHNTFRLISPTR